MLLVSAVLPTPPMLRTTTNTLSQLRELKKRARGVRTARRASSTRHGSLLRLPISAETPQTQTRKRKRSSTAEAKPRLAAPPLSSAYTPVVRDFAYPVSHPAYQMVQTGDTSGDDEVGEVRSVVLSDRQGRTDCAVVRVFAKAYEAEKGDWMSATGLSGVVGVGLTGLSGLVGVGL